MSHSKRIVINSYLSKTDSIWQKEPGSLRSHKKISVIWITIIVFVIADTSLSNIVQNLIPISTAIALSWMTVLFIIMVCVLMAGQFFILRFVKQKSKQVTARNDLHLKMIFRAVTIIQCILVGILVFVNLQMVVMSYYSVSVLMAAIIISYALAISMLGLLAQRFFSWFRSNKGAVVLLYGLSSAVLATNAALTVLDVSVVLDGMPGQIQSGHQSVNPMNFSPLGQMFDTINSAFTISSIVSFILTWIATSLILRHYSQKLGKVKYWVIMGAPVGYFLTQFIVLYLNLFASLLQANPIFFSILLTLIFTLSKAAGGMLFGIAFWTVAKNIRQSSIVRDYLIIAGYGLVLLFISNQAGTLVTVPYPPFGLASILFMGLSSYLLLVGIYSSSISVAEDQRLRQSVRNVTTKLLDMIGTAQMEKEIENRVASITKDFKDTLTQQTGIVSSLEDEDIEEYTRLVMEEVRLSRQNHKKD